MTAAEQTSSFADTLWARLLALLIAIALALFLWFNWSSDFKTIFAASDDVAPAVTSFEPAKPVNQALQECLVQRVGDVDRMKEEGILSESQYSAFRSRAEGLCRAQNPA